MKNAAAKAKQKEQQKRRITTTLEFAKKAVLKQDEEEETYATEQGERNRKCAEGKVTSEGEEEETPQMETTYQKIASKTNIRVL